MAGDDLVDDFVPDDLVALSDVEDDVEWSTEDSPPSNDAPEPSTSATTDVTLKKRKRRQKEKEKKAKVSHSLFCVSLVTYSTLHCCSQKRRLTEPGTNDETLQQDLIFATPPNVLNDYLTQHQNKAFKELSSIELEEFRIPESSIVDTTSWSGTRSLDLLPEFIAKSQSPVSTCARTSLPISI
jgi:protein CMS1